MNLFQPHLDPPPPPPPCLLPLVVDYDFFTVPILAYIMKGGEAMNGGLSKRKQKHGC